MQRPTALTLYALGRSGLVLAGLLLLGVGLGNTFAARSKLAQYRQVLLTTAGAPREQPPALFPKATETEERRELAHAKLGFYELLLIVGYWLSAIGFVLAAFGVLRLRLRTLRPPPGTPVSN